MSKKASKRLRPAKAGQWGRAERQRCIADAKRELALVEKEIGQIERLITAAQEDREGLQFQRMMVRGVLQILQKP